MRQCVTIIASLALGAFWSSSADAQTTQPTPLPVQLTGTIRDFSDAHPDFEQFDFNDLASLPVQYLPEFLGGIDQRTKVEPGIVANTLGGDGKPVHQGGTDPTFFKTADNAGDFNQWFNDVPGVNQSAPFSIGLNPIIPGSNILSFEDPATPGDDGFFPIDNQLLGNEGRNHNYHFTVELSDLEFIYTGGESFTFIGNDDAWVFINDQLVIDLGGVHTALAETVNLDELGLILGNEYNLDFFYAQRNTPESSFRIDTTIAFTGGGAIPIPLPPAVWSGLTTLAGLGAAGVMRARKRGNRGAKPISSSSRS